MTCRRKRLTETAATAKLARILSQDAAVGLDTEGRAWPCECGAWHVETNAKWKDEA